MSKTGRRGSGLAEKMVIYPLDRPEFVNGFVAGAWDFGRLLAPVLRAQGLEVATVSLEILASEVILPGGAFA